MKSQLLNDFKSGILAYTEAVYFLKKIDFFIFFISLIFNILIYFLGAHVMDQVVDLANSKLVSFINSITKENNSAVVKYIFKFLYITSGLFLK